MDSLRSMIDQIKKMYGPDGKSDVKYVGNYIMNNVHEPFITVCYYEAKEVDNFFWRTIDTNVLNYPFLAIQIAVTILVINLLHFFLKPLRQPRFIAGILGGTILGPSLLGNLTWFKTYIHSLPTVAVAETMGNISIVFYMFLVGLEIDMAALKLIRKVKLFRAIIGVVMPLALGVASYFLLVLERKNKNLMACAWWSITLTLTSFPDLVQILSEFKLLHKEIGRNALIASLVNHVAGWILIVVMITTRINCFMLFSSVSFFLLSWFVLRHAVCWAIKNTCSDGGRYNEVQVYFVLSGMMLSGFISDACGSQAYLGAFIFGLIIPKGEFGIMVIEKIEDVISVILLPIFFMVNGNRVVLNSVNFQVKVPALIASVALASTCKFITTFTISIIDGQTLPDSVTLGALSNTKGVLALILVNAARNVGVFDNQFFTIIVISLTIMASTVKPIMIVARMFNKPVKQFNYEGKTTEEIKSTFAEFRILACIPSTRYLVGIVKLLELSNPTVQSPLRILSAHLIELTEGSTATMLILDNAFDTHTPNVTHQKAESNQIANILEKYELQAGENVSVQQLQVTSAFSTMHEDVCLLVKEHRIDMILLPFYKYPNVHGVLRSEDACLKDVHKNILTNASCSVAVLIDRGLSSKTCFRFGNQTMYNFAMIFIGGPDDREALAYAYRMAGSPGVRLCVVRFLLRIEIENDSVLGSDIQESSTLTEEKLERLLDDEYAKEFILKTTHSRSITFMEARITSTEQIITTIGTLFDEIDLLIVGRGERTASPLTIKLSSEWHECEELGTLADTLVASEFAKRISILVVRHSHVSASRRLTRSSNQEELRKKKSRFSMFDKS